MKNAPQPSTCAAGPSAPSKTIAPNIADNGHCYVATAQVGRGRRRRKNFAYKTPIRTMTNWIRDKCAELSKVKQSERRLQGHLAGEVALYIGRLPKGRARANTRSYLMAWVLVLGEVGRKALTPARLQQVVTDWIDAGVAASTLKKRRHALATFLDAVGDGEAAAIVRKVKTPKEPKTPPRGADVDVLHAVIAGMDEYRAQRHPGRGGRMFRNKARARLLLWLWTGAEPATQSRLQPSDIDLKAGTITLSFRDKGDGVDAVTLPLLGRAPEACQAWLRAYAWGRIGTRALGRAFHTAVRSYVTREAVAGRTVTLPADMTPKHLRHSFLSWLHVHCEDAAIVQIYAQHLHLSTTMRYTQRVVSKRLKDVAAQVNRSRLQGVAS